MTKKERRERLKARILKNSKPHAATGCRLWTARVNNQGYPIITMRIKDRPWPYPMYAHRVALEVWTRPPKGREEAAHDPAKCPFKNCVEWTHLRWATRSENELDKRHPSRLMLREIMPPKHAVELEVA